MVTVTVVTVVTVCGGVEGERWVVVDGDHERGKTYSCEDSAACLIPKGGSVM